MGWTSGATAIGCVRNLATCRSALVSMPILTVLENLRFFGGAYRVQGNRLGARIEKLMSQLDLAGREGEQLVRRF